MTLNLVGSAQSEPEKEPRQSFQKLLEQFLPAADAMSLTDLLPENRAAPASKIQILKPSDIEEFLDRYVVGNNHAKKVLSLACYNHYLLHGYQFPVDKVDAIVKNLFTITKAKEQAAASIILGLTERIRESDINRRKDNPLRKEVELLFKVAVDSGIFRPKQLKTTDKNRQWKRGEAQAERVTRFINNINTAKSDLKIHGHKENVMIIGSTGTGKTELLRTLSRCINVPFVRIDATQITATGYYGGDIKDIPKYLLRAAKGDKYLAEKGIVFIDEVDKIATKTSGHEVNRTDVQNGLLGVLEDSVDNETGFNLSGVMFVLGGSFTGQSSHANGLVEIIQKRLGLRKIGFHGVRTESLTETYAFRRVEPQDLERFGLLKELVGRMSLTFTEPMDRDRLLQVLLVPEDSIFHSHKRILAANGVDLRITEDGARMIAELAHKKGTGARALKSVMSSVIRQIEHDAPDLTKPNRQNTFELTAETVLELWNSQFD